MSDQLAVLDKLRQQLQETTDPAERAALLAVITVLTHTDNPSTISIGDITASAGIAIGTGAQVVFQVPSDALALVDINVALKRLEQMPVEDVPDIESLSPGSVMPVRANPLFTGRDDKLRQLAAILKRGRTTVVIAGIGGVGKTSLAVEFAHRYGSYFLGGVFWLNFTNIASIQETMTRCGGAGGMRLPGFDTLSVHAQVERVVAEWHAPLPRLLIFDNCDDITLVTRFRPTTGGCCVLMTSRNPQWPAILAVEVIEVPSLSRQESITLLRRFRSTISEDDADLLAAALGDLPLALHLTGSYLARYRRVSATDYINELQRVSLEHPALQGRGEISPASGSQMPMSRVFAVSYKRLKPRNRVDKAALALLARAAWLAPGEPIARDLMLATMRADQTQATLFDLDDAIQRSVSLGLLELHGPGEAFRLHRLLALFLKTHTTHDVQARADVEAMLAQESRRLHLAEIHETLHILHLAERFEWSGRSVVAVPVAPLREIQVHLKYVIDQDLTRRDESIAQLCNYLGYHAFLIGEIQTAGVLAERALASDELSTDTQPKRHAMSLNNLGIVLHTQGHYAEALERFREAIDICDRQSIPPEILMAQFETNRAYAYKDRGEYDQAELSFQRALALFERNLERNHLATAQALINLAYLHKDRFEYQPASTLFERALQICEHVLGARHPAMAQCFSNLAYLHKDEGDYQTARVLLERAVQLTTEALGRHHPITTRHVQSLGYLLKDIGEYSAARTLFEETAEDTEQTFGPYHSATIDSRNSLGYLLKDIGEYETARSLIETGLAIIEQRYGKRHPLTASSLNSLAHLLKDIRRYDEARGLFEQALAIRTDVLGPNHRDTVRSYINLAYLLKDQGKFAEARPYFEQALRIREATSGPNHRDTVDSLISLADLLQAQGDADAAKPYIDRAIVTVQETFGPHHLLLAHCYDIRARIHRVEAQYELAREACKQGLEIRMRAWGERHRDVIRTMVEIADLSLLCGEDSTAQQQLKRAYVSCLRAMGQDHELTRAIERRLADLNERSIG